jgi:AraC family transcriptional regulator of arabinose operon
MRIQSGKEDLYTFPLSDTPAFDLDLMGTSYCDGSYFIKRDNINTWVFEFIVKGSGTLTVNDKTCHPRKGQCYIVPAYSSHTYFSSADDPWEKIFFNIGGALVASLISSYGIADVMLVEIPQLETIFRNGYARCLANPMNAHQVSSLTIHDVIATIARHRPRQEQKQTQRLHDFLATHPDRVITIDEMARIASLSVSQTIRLFKKEWQTTPYQFHLQCRIAAAQSLLRSSSMTIREISEDLGFSDEYHFASIFKKKTGIAPGTWRSGK